MPLAELPLQDTYKQVYHCTFNPFIYFCGQNQIKKLLNEKNHKFNTPYPFSFL